MSADEYREYAKECMDWARTAKTDREREILLQMAKTWFAAVLLASGEANQASLGLIPAKLPRRQEA